MQGDEFQRMSQVTNKGQMKKVKEDFDDISSIYTAHAKSNLEYTLRKRVHDRQNKISLLQDAEAFDLQNLQKQIESIQNQDF